MQFKDGYKYDFKPRYKDGRGHSIIADVLDASLPQAKEVLEGFKKYEKKMSSLSLNESKDATLYYWDNDFFPAFDALTLYGFIGNARPNTYLEIGSGFSTKVARFAIQQENLETKIHSIDPYPRAEIDSICDSIDRVCLEDADLGIFESLEPNDILFFDGSHRAFTNSDVTVFFCDILPKIKPGVIVQIHDIPWPEDYPDEWSERYYNEQYMLGMLLIYSADKFRVLMPNAHVSRSIPIANLFPDTIGRPDLNDFKRGGSSFWFTKKG